MRTGGFIIGLTLGTIATAVTFKKPIKRCLIKTITKKL